jgi:hypothetical protein
LTSGVSGWRSPNGHRLVGLDRPAAVLVICSAARYIAAAQAAGVARVGDEPQLTDDLLGQVVAAVRAACPAGHGAS